MQPRTQTQAGAKGSSRRFLIGPPQDSDELLQLFSLVLEKADSERKAGKRFGIPFAALLKLANRNQPSTDELSVFCREGKHSCGNSGQDWPVPLRSLLVLSSAATRKSSASRSLPTVGADTLSLPA